MTNRRNRQAEIRYRTSLRRIARAVGDIVNGRYDGSNDSITEIIEALERYSEIITPWATKVAENFTADIVRKNDEQWRKHSKTISRELRNLVNSAPPGQVMKSIVAEQVKYIKSLPLEAADLIVKDENAIQLIEDGLREVSCGYDAEYKQTEPGKAEQVDITGNHVALVPKGRAGNRCAIGDRDTMANQKKSWWTRMRTAIKTGDADTMNELVESAPASVTGDEGDLPQGVNLNINLSPQQPLPDKAPEMGGGPTGDSDDDLKTLLKALLAKLEGNATGDNDNKPDDNPTGDGEDDEEETTITGDSAWRAEVIVPGIDLSRKMKPTAFKREVLASADKTLVRQIVGDADIRKLPKQSVDMAFNAVSEIAKGRNTRATTGDAQRPNMGMTSIASLNKQNAEFWANRKG
ncbi:DUF2213 domain-containing protein [Escherichia coli]|nr:DUF2213 domain-containing protein [Escherichia coli]